MSWNCAAAMNCARKRPSNFFLWLFHIVIDSPISLALCVCAVHCVQCDCSLSMETGNRRNEVFKLYLYSSHNSGKIQDKFAWCVPNTTISYSAWVQSIGGKVLCFPLKRRSWSMIHIYVQFMPYARRFRCRREFRKKDPNKYLALNYTTITEIRITTTTTKGHGLIVSFFGSSFFFLCAHLIQRSHFFTRSVKSFNTLKW